MLNFKLVHYSSETLLKLVYFLVELLSDLHLELVVELFVDRNRLIVLLHLDAHLFNELLHFFYLGRYLDDLVLHLRVLKNALTTKHASVILTVELDFLSGMDFAIAHVLLCPIWIWLCYLPTVALSLASHGQSCENLVIYWQVLGYSVMSNFIVRTLDHLMFV